MLWATRVVDEADEAPIRELVTDQRSAFGRPTDLMLVALPGEPGKRHLWLGVSDEELLTAYYGFTPCLRRDLPKAPVLLEGEQAMFQAIFQSGG